MSVFFEKLTEITVHDSASVLFVCLYNFYTKVTRELIRSPMTLRWPLLTKNKLFLGINYNIMFFCMLAFLISSLWNV